MNRGILCFLVLGLSSVLHAADINYDNVASETKDISKVSTYHNSLDKSKRGAVKLSNTDSPSFNHLATSNLGGSVSNSANVGNTVGHKVASISTQAVGNQIPYRYLYNQYYHANPYFTYLQMPQAAAQIASQYSLQSNPVAHYLQTPTQIQYVSAPTVAQVSPVKYQTFSNEYSNAAAAAAETNSANTVTSSAQYTSPSHQNLVSSSQSYAPSSSSATQVSASASSAIQAKPVQVPLYSGYHQPAQPVYYSQQPLLTFYVQPQANPSNYVYQQPAANYLFKQQQPLLNFYGANRFGFYSPIQTSQVNYLVPQAETSSLQDTKATTSDVKSSDKTLTNAQHSSGSSSSYLYAAKA